MMNKSQKQMMEVVDLLKKSDVPYNLTLDYVDYDIIPYRFSEDLNEQPEYKLNNVFKKKRHDYILKIQIGDGHPLPSFYFRKYRTEQNEIDINYLKSVISDDFQDIVKVETQRELLVLQSFRNQYEEQIINLRRKKRLDDILDDNQPLTLES